ncbi:MAG: hypothetical protein WC730_02250 [Patescibacteria group bacterium]|jgi:uncharacterized protein YydD (DUF2326 family)
MQDESKNEILEAISEFSTQVDTRFSRIEGVLATQMVTKSYLDDKLVDLRGDLIQVIRKVDKKATKTIELLGIKKIFTPNEVSGLNSV